MSDADRHTGPMPDYYREGYDAFQNDIWFSTYPPESDAAYQWERGWHDALMETS